MKHGPSQALRSVDGALGSTLSLECGKAGRCTVDRTVPMLLQGFRDQIGETSLRNICSCFLLTKSHRSGNHAELETTACCMHYRRRQEGAWLHSSRSKSAQPMGRERPARTSELLRRSSTDTPPFTSAVRMSKCGHDRSSRTCDQAFVRKMHMRGYARPYSHTRTHSCMWLHMHRVPELRLEMRRIHMDCAACLCAV